MNEIKFIKIKEVADIKNNVLLGYSCQAENTNEFFVPVDKNNKYYQLVQEAIANGFKVEPAFTEEERFDYLKQAKKQEIKSALQKYLSVYHLPNGINVVNTLQEQSNNLNSLLFSQMAIKSPKWSASTDYKVNDVVYSSGVLLLCITAGTSDSSSNPTPPTEYGVAVTDGTAEWAKLGFLVKTDKGRIYFTPQKIIQMSEEATAILHKALMKYDTLKVMIINTTTDSDLEAIQW